MWWLHVSIGNGSTWWIRLLYGKHLSGNKNLLLETSIWQQKPSIGNIYLATQPLLILEASIWRQKHPLPRGPQLTSITSGPAAVLGDRVFRTNGRVPTPMFSAPPSVAGSMGAPSSTPLLYRLKVGCWF